MKLLCEKSNFKGWGLFTEGKEYEVINQCGNRNFLKVKADDNSLVDVLFSDSVYGTFKLIITKKGK